MTMQIMIYKGYVCPPTCLTHPIHPSARAPTPSIPCTPHCFPFPPYYPSLTQSMPPIAAPFPKVLILFSAVPPSPLTLPMIHPPAPWKHKSLGLWPTSGQTVLQTCRTFCPGKRICLGTNCDASMGLWPTSGPKRPTNL